MGHGSRGADTDIAHLLMCIAMAGMLAASVKTLPPHAWEAIFGLLTAWFAWRLAGDTKVNGLQSLVSRHRAAHLFHCAAMVYMFAALTTSDGMDMTGMGSGMARSLKYPAFPLAFAFVLVCYSVWDLVGQSSTPTLQPRGHATSWRHRADGSVPYRHGRHHGVHAANHELTRWVRQDPLEPRRPVLRPLSQGE